MRHNDSILLLPSSSTVNELRCLALGTQGQCELRRSDSARSYAAIIQDALVAPRPHAGVRLRPLGWSALEGAKGTRVTMAWTEECAVAGGAPVIAALYSA